MNINTTLSEVPPWALEEQETYQALLKLHQIKDLLMCKQWFKTWYDIQSMLSSLLKQIYFILPLGFDITSAWLPANPGRAARQPGTTKMHVSDLWLSWTATDKNQQKLQLCWFKWKFGQTSQGLTLTSLFRDKQRNKTLENI